MMRKLHLRVAAMVLLLVFTQKIGLRLWMHHWFHETRWAWSSANPAAEKLQLTCDCVDEALMPVTETPVYTINIPPRQCIALLDGYRPPFSAAEKLFCSLKGPPALSGEFLA